MAAQNQLPTFTLELKGDLKANWEYFEETFSSYVTLMGYRSGDKDPVRELAALKYSLPKEARLVLKNCITWADDDEKKKPETNLTKLRAYYAGTKNIIHERVEFNKLCRLETEPINHWETRCREQGTKCEYCTTCTPELIRDRFMVGINDDRLLHKLVNSAVKEPKVTLETIVLYARQYESTKDNVKTMTTQNIQEQVNFARTEMRKTTRSTNPLKTDVCPWCRGSVHLRGKSECPAQGKQCSDCGRMNHISIACLNPDKKWRQRRQRTQFVSGQAPAYSPHTKSTSKFKQQTHQLEIESDNDDTINYSNFCVDLQDPCATIHDIHTIIHVDKAKTRPNDLVQRIHKIRADWQESRRRGKLRSQGRKGKKYFTFLQLTSMAADSQFVQMRFQVDCGATCNTINMTQLRQIVDTDNPEYGIQPTEAILNMYNNCDVKPVGVIDLICMKNNKCLTLQFYVLEGVEFQNKPPLIHGTDSEILDIMRVNADEIHSTSLVETPPSCKPAVPLTEKAVKQGYSDVFKGLGSIGEPVHIQLNPEVTPVQAGIRRYPVSKTEKISQRIREMITDGYLTPVNEPTSWCSPMTAVEKTDNPSHPIRICMDPVKTLNMAIERPVYPMPTLEENLHHLVQAKCFTLADALVGFSQVLLDKESSFLTTMHTPIGRVRWLRLPFGISSAPEEFQRRQKEVLEGLDGIINIADDILIFGRGETYEEASRDHDENLLALLERAKERNLKLNPNKFRFKLKKVRFMGHMITEDGLVIDDSKVEAIGKMPVPENKKAVQRLLGMCNFLSKFLPKLSDTCAPLREVSSVNAEFSWSSPQQVAFQHIKDMITTTPVLGYFDSSAPVTLQVDASDYGLGAALVQSGKPVAYASSTMTKSEKDNYAQIEKECLAIVNAMYRWDQWLYGHPSILVETDHKPLESILKHPIAQAPKRLQKMMLKLQRYSFTVQYRKGSTMWLADTLSRAPLPRNLESSDKFEIFASEVAITETKPERITDPTFDLIKQATNEDPILCHLIPYIRHGWPEEKSMLPVELAPFWTYRSELTSTSSVIYKGTKILIPTVMRPRMLEKLHTSHQGVDNSIRNASDTLFWPSMRSDITATCERCQICAQYAVQHQKEPMMNHSIPDLPWQFVSQDILKHEGDHYLVTVDHYSDYFELNHLPDLLADTTVQVTKSIFARHGSPMKCLTDNGPQFISESYTKFAKLWNFEHLTSSPYFSQSNGRAEAAVKSAKNVLKKCVDPLLGLLHLRNTPTRGNTYSPVQRLMGRRTRTSIPILTSLLNPMAITPADVVSEKENQRKKSKYQYDKHAGPTLSELGIGEHVYLRPPPSQRSQPWKYGVIIEKPTPRSYKIRTPSGVARRNRRHLASTTEQPSDPISVDTDSEALDDFNYEPADFTINTSPTGNCTPSRVTHNESHPEVMASGTTPTSTHLQVVNDEATKHTGETNHAVHVQHCQTVHVQHCQTVQTLR